jgi:hypothetical protein
MPPFHLWKLFYRFVMSWTP